MSRTRPNIVITGTPGVGKTTHAEQLAERTGLKHLAVNQVVKDQECHEGWDDEFQSWIVDEDKVSQPFQAGRRDVLMSELGSAAGRHGGRRSQQRWLHH